MSVVLTWVPFLVMGLGALIGVLSFWSNRRKRQVLKRRPQLEPSALIAQEYGQMSVDLVLLERLWRDLARALRVSAGQLRPTDRFREELAPADAIGALNDPRDSVAKVARRFARERGQVIDLTTPQTLDDLMRAMSVCDRRSHESGGGR